MSIKKNQDKTQAYFKFQLWLFCDSFTVILARTCTKHAWTSMWTICLIILLFVEQFDLWYTSFCSFVHSFLNSRIRLFKICLPHVWEEYGFSESCIRKRDSLSWGRRQGRSMENSINHPYEYRLYHGPEGIYYLYYD